MPSSNSSPPPISIPSVIKNNLLAFVPKKNGLRKAYGFSLLEISQANINLHAASKLRIPFDKRRKSFYLYNIQTLKNFINNS